VPRHDWLIGSEARGGAVSRDNVADAAVAVLLRSAEHDERTYSVDHND